MSSVPSPRLTNFRTHKESGLRLFTPTELRLLQGTVGGFGEAEEESLCRKHRREDLPFPPDFCAELWQSLDDNTTFLDREAWDDVFAKLGQLAVVPAH